MYVILVDSPSIVLKVWILLVWSKWWAVSPLPICVRHTSLLIFLWCELCSNLRVCFEVFGFSPEELAESSLPARVGYKWVAEDVWTRYSLFRWSCLLKSWLNCILVLERNISQDIMALERVSAIDCVCHGQEGALWCATSLNCTWGCPLMTSPWGFCAYLTLPLLTCIPTARLIYKHSGCCAGPCISSCYLNASYTSTVLGPKV